MKNWVWRGLRTGIKTTRYPQAPEKAEGTTPGFPADVALESAADAAALVEICPTQALVADGAAAVRVDDARCVHCFRCIRRDPGSALAAWRDDFEWARLDERAGASRFGERPFQGSLQVLVVDGGDCGACLSEISQLSGPYYNVHRLGIFITPSPRHADVMIVVGPVTANVRYALLRAYDAMPEPRRVIAVGACALSGGVFGPSFAAGAGASEVLPVDVDVPGCPPPPLAILHALLLVTGRAAPQETVR
jgi:Ni,Fe-hydrogenase III small subunit/ferredoxin-like protein FixX